MMPESSVARGRRWTNRSSTRGRDETAAPAVRPPTVAGPLSTRRHRPRPTRARAAARRSAPGAARPAGLNSPSLRGG
jgi:hypothetical protein